MNTAKFALPLAVFGFLLIIATGTSLIINPGAIPLLVSIIGLIFLIIAISLQKKEKEKR